MFILFSLLLLLCAAQLDPKQTCLNENDCLYVASDGSTYDFLQMCNPNSAPWLATLDDGSDPATQFYFSICGAPLQDCLPASYNPTFTRGSVRCGRSPVWRGRGEGGGGYSKP